MLELRRRGLIGLPPARYLSFNPIAAHRRPEPFLADEPGFGGLLADLGPLEFLQVRRRPQEKAFNSLLEAYHDPGCTQPVGEQRMSSEQRLAHRQEHSGPVMKRLEVWMKTRRDERLVEPNSGLDMAIQYLPVRWDELTRFLDVPGAPLDNNLAERASKRAIRNCKYAMFDKTRHGARSATST